MRKAPFAHAIEWSFRACLPRQAKRGICFLSASGTVLCFAALFLSGLLLEASSVAKEPSRPRITGIHHVRLYVTEVEKSRAFYGNMLGLPEAGYRCASASRSCFAVSWGRQKQHVELELAPSTNRATLLAELAFTTDNVVQMRRYLVAQGVAAGAVESGGDYTQHFESRDPEGNLIVFVGYPGPFPIDDPPPSHAAGEQIIHAGFVVHDRTAMDKFYKDILGFHVYWHGGMKDNRTDWLDLQVPEGTDWIEFMLNVPADADKHLLGIMNHIALGVPDIHAAAKQLLTNGMKLTEEPQIGRDGKWQLNLYDPDDTRVELMEFTPVEKPCCSDYTGPHPKP
jgi:catechol 2,3-dioxygenase-like lactoylglutathione lyase family enzyme